MTDVAPRKTALSQEMVRHLNEIIPKEKQEHYNYQDLASLVQVLSGERPEVGYKHEQIPLDQERYEWLKTRIASLPKISSVLEIGGNLGYICLRLAKDLGLKAACFEPIQDYVKISNFLAREFGLEKLYESHRAFVLWDNIAELPVSDVIINLNVIHHAGRVFDCDVVEKFGSWSAYAQSYLEKLARKGRYLFFQTGNTWPAQRLFENTEAPEFLAEVLRKSGWRTIDIGICANLPELTLSSYAIDQIDSIPRIWCRRNEVTDLVDYYHDKTLLASFPTGLAQRPLFFCESTA